MTDFIKQYFKEQYEINEKMLSKIDADLRTCGAHLVAVKLMVTALELKMTSMKTMHQDLMELREIIVLLNPHLKKPR